MFTGKLFKGYAETVIKPCGYDLFMHNKSIFMYFYNKKIEV